MDSLKLHQLLNYYPAIGMIAGAIVLAVGLALGNAGAVRFALKLVVVVALLTIVVAFAGEFASWDTALYAGTRGEALGRHKILGTVAFAVVELAGVASLVVLRRLSRDRTKGKWAVMIAAALAIIASVLLVTVILRGRQVKWAEAGPELRPAEGRSIAATTARARSAENGS